MLKTFSTLRSISSILDAFEHLFHVPLNIIFDIVDFNDIFPICIVFDIGNLCVFIFLLEKVTQMVCFHLFDDIN